MVRPLTPARVAAQLPWQLLDVSDSGAVVIRPGAGAAKVIHRDGREHELPSRGTAVVTAAAFIDDSLIVTQNRDLKRGRSILSLVDAASGASRASDIVAPGDAALVERGAGWFTYLYRASPSSHFDLRCRVIDVPQLSAVDMLVLAGQDQAIWCAATTVLAQDSLTPNLVSAVSTFTPDTFGSNVSVYEVDTKGSRKRATLEAAGLSFPVSVSTDGSKVSVVSDGLADRPAILTFDESGKVVSRRLEHGEDLSAVRRGTGDPLVIRSARGRDVLEAEGTPVREAGALSATASASGTFIALTSSDYSQIDRVEVYDANLNISWIPRGQPDTETSETTALFSLVAARDGLAVPVHLYWRKDQVSSVLDAPIVVVLHGGPQDHEREQFSPLRALLNSHGYLVVAPDVRGSSGYGRRWRELDDKDLRDGSIRDVQDVFSWLRDNGYNVGQASVLGASYGGFLALASASIGRLPWRGCISLSGIASFRSYLATTAPHRRAVMEAEYGTIEKHGEFLDSISPLVNVDLFAAPVLSFHGAQDDKVALSEPVALHSALAELGVAERMIVFDDEGHGITTVRNWERFYTEVLDALAAWTNTQEGRVD